MAGSERNGHAKLVEGVTVFNKGGLLGWRTVGGVDGRLDPWFVLCVVCCVLVLDHVPQSTARVTS